MDEITERSYYHYNSRTQFEKSISQEERVFYAIFLLILFVILLLIVCRRSLYAYFFLLMVLGCVVSLFAIVLHINTFGSYYSYGENSLFAFDYEVYRYVMSHIRISLKTAIRIMNLGLTIYLVAMPLFIMDFCRYMLQISKRTKTIIYIVLALVPLFQIFICDPDISTHIYLFYHNHSMSPLIYGTLKSIEIWLKSSALLLSIGPAVLLIYYAQKNTIPIIRRKLIRLTACLLSFNLLYDFYFYIGPFSISADKALKTGFWIFEKVEFERYVFFYWFPVLILILMTICIFILFNFQLDSLLSTPQKRRIHKNIQMMNNVLGQLTHSYKNQYFIMKILCGKLGSEFSELEKHPDFVRLKEIADEGFSNTGRMLDSLNEVKYSYRYSDIAQIIQDAVHESVVPSHIDIECRINRQGVPNYLGMYDQYHLKKAIINVINNAIEAIVWAQRKKGKISVEVQCVLRSVVISITDNGTGIPKSEIKDIFTPHYSKKAKGINWGLGLPYVYNVIKAHLGQVIIESKVNHYTSVLLILPIRSGGNP